MEDERKKMRIKSLCLENFKCFRKIDVDFGRITLLTGANSSGKSSIIYGVLGALQSERFPFRLYPNGKYAEMGDFREMSHMHEQGNTIRIKLSIWDDSSLDIDSKWVVDKVRRVPMLGELEVKSDYYTLSLTKEKGYNLSFVLDPDKDPQKDIKMTEFYSGLMNVLHDVLGESGENLDSLNETRRMVFDDRTRIDFAFTDLERLNELVAKKGNLRLTMVLSAIAMAISQLERSSNYIGSFRLSPERTYYDKAKADMKVGKSGEGYTDQLISWEVKERDKFNELERSLRSINLLKRIKVKHLDGGRYEILVNPQGTSKPYSLADVGFGINQFIPILVADIQLGDGSMLFISQPELHLHPSVQASFADYLLSQIKKTKKNYVIETHSEYFINRIRLGISKGEIASEDVSTYFLQNDGARVAAHRLSFSKSGKIENAPDDFFKTYMMDVMDIALASTE